MGARFCPSSPFVVGNEDPRGDSHSPPINIRWLRQQQQMASATTVEQMASVATEEMGSTTGFGNSNSRANGSDNNRVYGFSSNRADGFGNN
ncbi:hypothetical protein SLEP1_g55051 [Rubroshorea leprosula]|uniref:Uncharacterized protein n=1 Tax=Rubroshorea leprosula TaxID=152421 RepID=A0AAV5MFC2_9ROSI|nr:hypothetical protein SLEP1_g55051 [Rubroshorea leprosula]